MRCRILILALVSLTAFAIPVDAQVNSAAVSGSVTDESGGAVPGVTITAVERATGRQLLAVSNETGEYRLVNIPPGTYRLQAELVGFATVVVPDVELLVGQNATIPFVLTLAGVEETLTVTAETPLVDLTSSQVTGNVDRRQMEALPLQGRNWMELSMLVKGITANNVDVRPGTGAGDAQFQLNLDGQQITQRISLASFGQPRFSREAIAEFQVVTNLFDITQGRSTGIQVNAITRSGTNEVRGSVFGFFRSDRLNAPDPVVKRVLPYSNQQVGGVIGGPIVRDKLLYFGSYEYEREPFTVVSQPVRLPGQSFTTASQQTNKSYLGRLDYQRSNEDNVTIRGSRWDWSNPDDINSSAHPSRVVSRTRDATTLNASWSHVYGPGTVGELRLGYNRFAWNNESHAVFDPIPEHRFPGFTIGGHYNFPAPFWTNDYYLRSDFTALRGKHEFKVGGEFLSVNGAGEQHFYSDGVFVYHTLPPDLNERFPADAAYDPSRWNFVGLEPYAQFFLQNFDPQGDWAITMPRPTLALWFGDTWRVTDRLTLNYGVRWDDDWGATAPPNVIESVILIDNGFPPDVGRDFGHKANIRDHNNVAPRVGFAYGVGESNDLVIRGGSGLYYSVQESTVTSSHQQYSRFVAASFDNDEQPGWIQDPLRGVTEEDILAGRVPLPPQAPRIIDPEFVMPYTWQTSLGFQKQLGPVTGVEADLTHWHWYRDMRTRDPNLFLDPATGYNVDPAMGRPNDGYGQITWYESDGEQDYLALSTSVTRRLQDRFQGGLTYTLMFYKRDDGTFGYTEGNANNQFDRAADWARSGDFQRHTLRVHAMYQLPWDVSVSALYMFGSGNYTATTHASRPYGKPGQNRLNLGPPVDIPTDVRSRFDGPDVIGTGSVLPRNALRGTALHKVDLRVTKDVRIGDRFAVSVMAEVFNVFNHANYGSFVGQVNSARFGEPNQSTGNAYAPRSGQLGFRVTF